MAAWAVVLVEARICGTTCHIEAASRRQNLGRKQSQAMTLTSHIIMSPSSHRHPAVIHLCQHASGTKDPMTSITDATSWGS